MPTRVLISDDGLVRRFKVLDDTGQQTGIEEETYPTVEQVNAAQLRQRAAQAFATNSAYLGLANPTAAQTTAHLQRMTRQVNALGRLLLGQSDTTSDT